MVVRELLKRYSEVFYSQKVVEFDKYLNYQLSSLGYDHSSQRPYDKIMLIAQASMQALLFRDKPGSFGIEDAGFMAFSYLGREIVNAIEKAANTSITDEQHAIRVAQYEGFNFFTFRNVLAENVTKKKIFEGSESPFLSRIEGVCGLADPLRS